jgi:all-trans-8'-apo-beta-carotenal 15,15'-oxygenase
VVLLSRLQVPGFCLIHDFIITENYYIFIQAPLTVNPFPYLFGLKGIASGISMYQDKPSMVYLIPRNAELPRIDVPVDTHFSFHHANAYEEDGKVRSKHAV